MPAAFLMQQMQWREMQEEAQTETQWQTLRDAVDAAQRELVQQCAQHLDVQGDYPAAVQTVRALMFLDKFARDLDSR
jgi:molecular chaperone HscB